MVTLAQVLKVVQRVVQPIASRTRGLIRRGTIGTLGNGAQGQTIQAETLADDVDDEVELIEPYGFTAVPPNGAECIVLRVGGNRAGSVAILAGDRAVRIQGLAQGEVAMYHPNGASIVIRDNGDIEVTPGDGAVVRLGGADAELEVARRTDPVHREQAMIDWMTAVEAGMITMAGLFNAAAGPMLSAPGTITPEQIPTPISEPFATINAGGEGSVST